MKERGRNHWTIGAPMDHRGLWPPLFINKLEIVVAEGRPPLGNQKALHNTNTIGNKA